MGGGHSFDLTWHRKPGILVRDGRYITQETIVAALEQTFEEWVRYTRLINPLPFYDFDGDGLVSYGYEPQGDIPPFSVAFNDGVSGFKLDNTDPDNVIVLHRYWPNVIDAATGIPVSPSRITWLGTEAARIIAFKKAVAEIEAMIASIETSPLYGSRTFIITDDFGRGGVEVPNPLMLLYDAMGEFIAFNPPLEECGQRDGFDWIDEADGRKTAIFAQGLSGPLYEYFLGYAPHPSDYRNPAGPLALPEE
ncbi:hypothetical protein FACS189476_12220 [Spirochaetia bacterium]|nr:hypothetical protein FACS189476_12220 [Spirochaetia bacterium]